MFKKLSLQFHKSPHVETAAIHHQDHINRDSLIDPNVNSPAGYPRDTFIEPNTSTMAVKPVSTLSMNSYQYTEHDPSHYASYSYHQDDDHYHHPHHGGDDLKLPPLTIEHPSGTTSSLAIVSPASIPSPITPITQTSSKQLSPEAEVEAFVHQGISFHEKGQLEKATQHFRIGAEKGNPIGMFLYGVSLRHGWGCKKNEHAAFQYLQKAAEHAVEDLANIKNTVNASASKGELIMAIYELGVSFRHGWGCKKNKESAVQFFKIAADLGDPDAQNDLGHCYYHGQGVKKDLYLAAKYYRKADKQGQGIMGNSWIWKPKYDKPK